MPADGTGVDASATLILTPGGLADAEEAWRELAVAAENPYLTPEWYGACLARGALPAAIVVRAADGSVDGILPLVRDPGRLVRRLRFPGDDLGDTFAMLAAPFADPFVLGRLAGRCLRASGIPWDLIALSYVDADAPWIRGFAVGLGDVTPLLRNTVTRPWVDLSAADWEGFLSTLKRSDRKEVRRRERRALEAGARYRLVQEPGDAEAGMAEMLRLHDLRWDSMEGASSLGSPAARRLLTDFAERAARQRWLRIWMLEVGGRPAAAELAWRIGGRQLHFQGGFDPEHASLGVGLVLFAHALQDGLESDAREADLGMGESSYKRRFTREARTASRLVLVHRHHVARPLIALALRVRARVRTMLPAERRSRLRGTLRRR